MEMLVPSVIASTMSFAAMELQEMDLVPACLTSTLLVLTVLADTTDYIAIIVVQLHATLMENVVMDLMELGIV